MAKAKTAKAKTGKRNAVVVGVRTALRDACPHVMIENRPLSTDGSGRLATRVTEFATSYETHLAAVRAHVVDGGAFKDAPPFPASKFFDPNSALLSQKQWDDLLDAEVAEGAKDGSVHVPPRYNPVQAEAAHVLNCRTLRRGSLKVHPKQPANWDAKKYGSWMDTYDQDGETITEPSGMFFDDDLPRRSHAEKAEDLITDDAALLTFGNLRIVCGDGSHDGAAAFIVRAHKTGNYGRGDDARKRLSLANIKLVRDVVFRIEDRPNNGGAFVMKARWVNGVRVITEIPFMPGQVLTAGNLFDSNGKQIAAGAIRKLDVDTKGLKFKALVDPIVGKAIPFVPEIWKHISQDRKGLTALRDRVGRSDEYETGTPQEKSITNIRTTARTSPFARNCFGLRSVQTNMVPFTEATGEGRVEDGHFRMGVVIGVRSADAYDIGVHAANAASAPKAAAPKAAPKAAKKAAPKAVKKDDTQKSKSTKPDAKKSTDAAPPVEADTADEKETVEAS